MFRENLNGSRSMSVFGIVTSSCKILYNMTRRASDLRSARLCQFKCSIMLLTLSNIPSSPSLYLFKLSYVFFGV
jgi:hypothetical protein